jgi:hypothetical protein
MQKLLLLPVALIVLLAFNTQNKTKVIFWRLYYQAGG